MDEFLDFLIKKASTDNNEYFNYRQPKRKKPLYSPVYKKMTVPEVNDYVVFDFETTGMSPIDDRIIEIGAVKVVNNTIVDKFSQLVNPQKHITKYISEIVNITNSMVEDCPPINDILPQFLEFIEEYPLIAHNARFDMGFLLNNAHKLGYNIQNIVLDTVSLSRKINKDCEKHNLNYLTKHFNIGLTNAHRAYYDAEATFELYKIIQKRYYNSLS